MTRSKKHRGLPIFLWHRRLGLIATLFMMMLAITGIMLNHTDALSLDKTHIKADWLLDWYELQPDSKPISFTVDDLVITQWDAQLFINSKPVLSLEQPLRGASRIDSMLVIALQQSILLFDLNSELLEQIDTRAMFPAIHNIGIQQHRLVIKTSDDQLFQADQQVINWTPADAVNATWSTSSKLPSTLKTSLLQHYRGTALTLEKVILDLHSGRIFNARWGSLIMDISALTLIGLCLSGIWVWSSRKRKMRVKKHYRKHHRRMN